MPVGTDVSRPGGGATCRQQFCAATCTPPHPGRDTSVPTKHPLIYSNKTYCFTV